MRRRCALLPFLCVRPTLGARLQHTELTKTFLPGIVRVNESPRDSLNDSDVDFGKFTSYQQVLESFLAKMTFPTEVGHKWEADAEIMGQYHWRNESVYNFPPTVVVRMKQRRYKQPMLQIDWTRHLLTCFEMRVPLTREEIDRLGDNVDNLSKEDLCARILEIEAHLDQQVMFSEPIPYSQYLVPSHWLVAMKKQKWPASPPITDEFTQQAIKDGFMRFVTSQTFFMQEKNYIHPIVSSQPLSGQLETAIFDEARAFTRTDLRESAFRNQVVEIDPRDYYSKQWKVSDNTKELIDKIFEGEPTQEVEEEIEKLAASDRIVLRNEILPMFKNGCMELTEYQKFVLVRLLLRLRDKAHDRERVLLHYRGRRSRFV